MTALEPPTTTRRQRNAAASKRGPANPPRRTIPRTIAAALILIASLGSLFFLRQGLLLETAIAQWGIENVLGIGSELERGGELLTVGIGTTTIFSIQLVVACSVTMLVVPLGVVASTMLATGRASVFRAVPAFVLGAVGLLLVNALRLLLIAGMTHSGHLEGFGWSHSIYGSLIALGGLALVLIGFVWFVTGPRQKNEA